MRLSLIVSVFVYFFVALVLLGALVFLIVEALDKVESFKQRAPKWLVRFIESRQAFSVLFLLCIVLLIGNGYETLQKEIPDVPEPPIIKAPPPPIFTPPLLDQKGAETTPKGPELISSLMLALRVSCILRDPSRLPEDSVLHVPRDPTFLVSAIGKVYFEASDGVHFQRLDEEGKAYVVQLYQVPANSSLLGQRIQSLSSYDRLTFSTDLVDGRDFTTCSGLEITLKANGREILRHVESFSAPMNPEGGTLGATIRLPKLNLSTHAAS